MEIDKVLNDYPALISRAIQEAEELRLEWKKGDVIYDNNENKYSLNLLALEPSLKMTEIKIKMGSEDSLYSQRLEVVKLESDYRKKDGEIKALEHTLNSAKVLSRKREVELHNLHFGGK